MSLFGKKSDQSYSEAFKEKLSQYGDSSKAKDWLNKNTTRVRALFENYKLRDFILEPFKDVFKTPP